MFGLLIVIGIIYTSNIIKNILDKKKDDIIKMKLKSKECVLLNGYITCKNPSLYSRYYYPFWRYRYPFHRSYYKFATPYKKVWGRRFGKK